MRKQVMHCLLGQEVDGPALCKIRMANNTNVHCVGVIKDLKVKTLGIEVVAVVIVMLIKGEAYPMILERPWLMTMKAKKSWDT